jgi:hypothetical protein
MEDTMRDLLSKLDAIISETELKSPEDLAAKRKALQDLEIDPVASNTPEIAKAIIQRKSDLEKEAKAKGFSEGLEVGDEFGISFSEDFEIGAEIVGFAEDGVIIELDETALNYLQENGINFLEGELVEGLKDPKDNPCWKGYKPVGTKQKGGKTVPNCVPKESIDEDHGPEDPTADYNQGEYDREGDMAKDQLRTIDNAAEELYAIISANENLPEWVQKKITLAMDYIDTVRDYMKANKYVENVNVDEAEYQGRKVQLGKKMPGDVKKYKVYVRKPNGNVVKVNFGDKKMRIKKSNPARRKSFRARHNCSNPGPRWKARYWSCRNW